MERPVLFRVEQASTTVELQAQCAHAMAAGFDGIELPLDAACSGETDLTVIAVAGRCVAYEIGHALEEVTTLIRRAAGLHAQCLNLTIPPLARGGGDGGFAHYQDALNFAYWLLHRARYEAEAAGVAVALEAAANGCLLSPVELREIIDEANSWAVGACIDVSRTLKIGSPADWLTTLRGRVHAVRVRDIHLAARPGSTTSDETVDVEAIGAALDDIQYERPVIALGQGQLDKIRMGLTKLGCPLDK